jgi:hypothetical protein
MIWKSGQIVRIKDYRFDDDNSIRDKYSIVLYADDKFAYIIHSLTTSQNNQNVEIKNIGCSLHKGILPYFIFPKNIQVGDNGFYFEKDTFVFFKSNVRKEDFVKFESASKQLFGIIELGILNNYELKRIIKCALKSNFLSKEIIRILTDFKEKLK